MDRLAQDVRFGLRLLVKDRGFAFTAIATLSLCLAGNLAIFTLVDTVLLRPLPYPDPDQLVQLANAYPKAGVADGGSNSVPDYFDRRQLTDVFSAVAIYRSRGLTIGSQGSPERVPGVVATPSLLSMLGARAARGRLFTEGDAVPGRERVVLLAYGTWQRLFAGRDDAVGRDVRINGQPYTVVGVLDPGFRFVDGDATMWLPAAFEPRERADDQRHSNNWSMLARLQPGVSIQQAQQRVDALNARVIDIIPGIRQVLIDVGYHTPVRAWQERLVGPLRATLYLLWGGVLFVLLIGCVNIANLAAIRATTRVRELATRHALGAGTARLARLLLTESTIVAMIGGLLGLLLARWGLAAAGAVGLGDLPRGHEVAIDVRVGLFALGLVLAVGVLIGLAPILMVRHSNLAQIFRDEGRSGTAGRRARLARRVLVAAQVGFAVVLLCGAGLLFASFQRILAIDPGFEPRGVIAGMINTPPARYADAAAVRSFWDRLIARVEALPGVQSAGLTTSRPLADDVSDSVILPEGYRQQPGRGIVSPAYVIVSPGTFRALGMHLVSGRFFTASDVEGAQPAIIVDERLAQVFWPGRDAIGQRLYQPDRVEDLLPGPGTRWMTVVGVVRPVRLSKLEEGTSDRPGAYYMPAAQHEFGGSVTLVAKTAADPESLIGPIRREIGAIDPEMPYYDVRTLEQQVELSLTGRRMPMLMALGFAGLALLLAAVGLYGSLAYQMAQRTREIGIRMALGATASSVIGMVMREGAIVVGAGLACGFAGAFALREALASQLYRMSATDPRVVGGVILVLAAVAAAACWLPARTAARTNPVRVLGNF